MLSHPNRLLIAAGDLPTQLPSQPIVPSSLFPLPKLSAPTRSIRYPSIVHELLLITIDYERSSAGGSCCSALNFIHLSVSSECSCNSCRGTCIRFPNLTPSSRETIKMSVRGSRHIPPNAVILWGAGCAMHNCNNPGEDSMRVILLLLRFMTT